jgi:hypothetical protein
MAPVNGYFVAHILPLGETDREKGIFIGCMPLVCANLSVMRDPFIELMKDVFAKFCADHGLNPSHEAPEPERKH